MDNYSGLGGPSGVPPGAERVWAVQKKRKTSDQHRRQQKNNPFGKDEKGDEESRNAQGPVKEADRKGPLIPEGEEETGYGPGRPTVKKSGKIDLVI